MAVIGAGMLPPAQASTDPDNASFALELSGASYHLRQAPAPNHYNQENWGVGLEYRKPLAGDEDWTAKYSAGTLVDSYYGHGGYAGAVLQKQLLANEALRVDAGAGLFLFYRRLEFNGPLKLIPAPAPVVTLGLGPTPFSLNITGCPSLPGGWTGFVFAQLVAAF